MVGYVTHTYFKVSELEEMLFQINSVSSSHILDRLEAACFVWAVPILLLCQCHHCYPGPGQDKGPSVDVDLMQARSSCAIQHWTGSARASQLTEKPKLAIN